ncbi:hypothetical protein AKH19_02345 [Pelagibacteraceae bacterium GOM-A1]|nr:hypothetical protein AKH19_02345 [Pelagibacteraceae bacterium GOM-A1]
MLGKLRGFTNSKLAGVLVAIIIVPFVFWGMGSVFSGGNTNNIAKINNNSISTKDFIDHINRSRINPDYIKENLDNNILERILSDLISKDLMSMEYKDLNVKVSDRSLKLNLQNDINFLDDDKNFSRLKYEKFLLENNIIAAEFENRLKISQFRKRLFDYIGGGIKSPYYLQNKIYINENKKINIQYYDLEYAYDKNISDVEINNYIIENEENLKEAYIDFSYAKVEPSNLIEINEFNEDFYKKIDEIENDILNEVSLEDIARKNEIKLQKKNNFKFVNEDDVFKEIYENKEKKEIVLKDKDNYFLLYQITKINNLLPNKNDTFFRDKVKNRILLKKKFDLNKNLFEKIQNKDFIDADFNNLVRNKENIKSGIINSINDDSLFDETSLKLIYELPKNSFVMVSNRANNIFLAKINQITYENLKSTNENIQEYLAKTNINLIDDIYSSYDTSLNTKYEVKIFNNNIDRIKDYFK